jgi:hypothetical protein
MQDKHKRSASVCETGVLAVSPNGPALQLWGMGRCSRGSAQKGAVRPDPLHGMPSQPAGRSRPVQAVPADKPNPQTLEDCLKQLTNESIEAESAGDRRLMDQWGWEPSKPGRWAWAADHGGATGGHRATSARRHTWVWQTNSTQPLTTRVESERSCSDPL